MIRNLFGLLLLGIVVYATDPCLIPADHTLANGLSYGIISPSEAKKCIFSLPFDSKVRNETIKQLEKLIQLYSFTDIVLNSGDPWNLKVDLRAGLASIRNKTYENDFDFHLDLIVLFNALFDAHTLYYAPQGYMKFLLLRAFSLTSFVDNNGTQKISVAGVSEIVAKNRGVNLTPYIGKTLTSINGRDPMEFLEDQANSIGGYKDGVVRFNVILKEEFTVSSYATMFQGFDDFEQYQFEDMNETLKIPGSVAIVGGLNGTADFMKLNRFTPPHSMEKKAHAIARGPDHLKEHVKHFKTKPEIVSDNWKLIASTKDTFFGIINEDTAVLKLTTFAPSGSIPWKPWSDYINLMENAMLYISENNIKKLIIDVVGNGGGYVCLSYSTLQFLSKTFDGLNVFQPYDHRESNVSDTLFNIGYLDGEDKFLLGTTHNIKGKEWYSDGPIYTRGGHSSKYTEKFFMPCAGDADPFYMNNQGVYVDEIIVLTDGSCGSACNYFISKIKQHKAAKIVAMGGEIDTKFAIGSFAGGDVLDWTPFVSEVKDYARKNNVKVELPDYLPTSAATRFNFEEAYFEENVPREFQKMTADVYLKNWDFAHPVEVYKDLIPLFTGNGEPKNSKPWVAVVGVVVVIVIIAVIAVMLVIRKKKRNAMSELSPLLGSSVNRSQI